MMNEYGFSALSCIYETSINLGRWRRALDAVSDAVDARAVALVIRDSHAKSENLHMLNSTYLDFTRTAWGLYYVLRLSKLQEPDWQYLSRQPVHCPVPDTAIGPSAEELDRRADYALLRKRLGISRRLGVKLNPDPIWFDGMSIAFDSEYSEIPRTAFERTRFLLPHLSKAIEIGRIFRQLRSRYSAVLDTLDHVKVGLCLANRSGEIIVENEEARRIFDGRDGVSKSKSGHLHFNDPAKSAELRTAIERTADTAGGTESTSEHVITANRKSGKEDIILDVSPLRDSGAELHDLLDAALITIIDPERVPDLPIQRFVALYGLTTAEADVCRQVILGRPLDAIAEVRGTTPTTIKNQVSAILSKTGVSKRSELVRLVVRILPPIQ